MKYRLKEFMDHKKLSGAELADTIGVQRSNVSHILNGRNNPGAQFIEKLLLAYPDLDAGWLLTGKGTMIRAGKEPEIGPAKFQSATVDDELTLPLSDVIQKPGFAVGKPDVATGKPESLKSASVKKIERIVVFYDDRSFIDYFPG